MPGYKFEPVVLSFSNVKDNNFEIKNLYKASIPERVNSEMGNWVNKAISSDGLNDIAPVKGTKVHKDDHSNYLSKLDIIEKISKKLDEIKDKNNEDNLEGIRKDYVVLVIKDSKGNAIERLNLEEATKLLNTFRDEIEKNQNVIRDAKLLAQQIKNYAKDGLTVGESKIIDTMAEDMNLKVKYTKGDNSDVKVEITKDSGVNFGLLGKCLGHEESGNLQEFEVNVKPKPPLITNKEQGPDKNGNYR